MLPLIKTKVDGIGLFRIEHLEHSQNWHVTFVGDGEILSRQIGRFATLQEAQLFLAAGDTGILKWDSLSLVARATTFAAPPS